MILLQLALASGVVYAGTKALRRFKIPALPARKKQAGLVQTDTQADTQATDQVTRQAVLANDKALTAARSDLLASSLSIGLATGGTLFKAPLLGIASLPVVLYVFTPVFRNAGNKLRGERKINDQVLIATSVGVCVVMGYTATAALDALLYSFFQWVFARKEQVSRQNLQAALPAGLPAHLHAALEQAAAEPSRWQTAGESRGETVAPWMLASFVLTLPLVGPNRAAGFLTTTFGSNLQRLGPYTAQHFIQQAAREGILILRADTLERLAEMDTLLLDSALLDEQAQQPMQQRLAEPLASGQCRFVASPAERDSLLAELQQTGKTACYISRAEHALAGRQALALQLFTPDRTFSDAETTDYPDLILLGCEVQQAARAYQLASEFAACQRLNLDSPIGCDLLNIYTSLFMNLGLLYSVLFTYTGLFLGVSNTEWRGKLPQLPRKLPAPDAPLSDAAVSAALIS